jgi:hypothetical protein
MGRIYRFECSACGYIANVSGGDDKGELFATRTVSCATCRALGDAIVQSVGRLRCPMAGPRSPAHDITPWTHPGPCPRCGAELSRDESGVPWE